MQNNKERAEQFKIFNKIRSKAPDVPAEEIEKDVRGAIHAVRKKRA